MILSYLLLDLATLGREKETLEKMANVFPSED